MTWPGGLRSPAPLTAGDVVGVTAPSSGVPDALRPRLEVAVRLLEGRGLAVRLGDCLDGAGIVSASAADRADELMAMLLDPAVRAVVPPWGGELAVELLPLLDLDALAAVEPTWVVGFSDISTLLLPITTRAGWATVHSANLLDSPYGVPEPLVAWLDVVTAPTGTALVQGSTTRHRRDGHDDWVAEPAIAVQRFDTDTRWRPLDPAMRALDVGGVLIGGCTETVGILAGTPFGDLARFADDHAPDGLLVYVEASDEPATAIARHLWRMRLAGWFERANAVLVGRTAAPDADGFTQDDAVRSALGDLGLPVLLDVDCGHLPPQLTLVNGASAHLSWTPDDARLTQQLPPV